MENTPQPDNLPDANATNHAPADTQPSIDAGELAFLQQVEAKRGKLFYDLGAIAHQARSLEQQREQVSGELDHLDREYLAFSNRLTQKYGLAPNARVDLQSGAIS